MGHRVFLRAGSISTFPQNFPCIARCECCVRPRPTASDRVRAPPRSTPLSRQNAGGVDAAGRC
eukprot:6022117-Prymnesium_polylepis.1